MKKLLSILIFSIVLYSNAQTLLNKGDIVVIGVNANNNSCSATIVDKLFFVTFKDIQFNTEFFITDNRYISGNNFSTTEGVMKFKRIGATLPAGSVISVNVLTNGTGQSNGWQITKANSGNPFNLSTSGDQIIAWQGNWDDSGTISGEFLFAYNTKSSWNNNVSSSDSTLPDDLQCFHITPDSGTNSYRHYNGPATPVSKAEWMVRIHNPANWVNESNCTNFNSNFTISNTIINSSTSTQTVCQDEETNEIILEYAPNATYQWFSNTIASTTGGTMFPGENSNSFTPPSNSGGTVYYYCEITINISLDGSNCLPYKSNLYQIITNQTPITSNIVQH